MRKFTCLLLSVSFRPLVSVSLLFHLSKFLLIIFLFSACSGVFFYIVVLYYSLFSSFWSALSAVLFSFLQLVSSRYPQSASQQFSLAETM